MSLNKDFLPKKVLLLGSGGLRIGQAGEFDYSGSQALKALREESIRSVLVNPNIATVQTDPGMADDVYLQPLNFKTVTRIIEREKPDAILLGFGGQTALNLGLELEEKGVLKKHHVKVLGTPVSAIRTTEDRELFKTALSEVGIKTARSMSATSVEAAHQAAEILGYPVMVRSGFSLGGLGSGRVNNPQELEYLATSALSGSPQILIEEYLEGWKEIEYEIVRDSYDNTVTVCNMENLDPMGIHTGESIVIAPSQTLNNEEYHLLREVAIRAARHLGIVGECNIQYAVSPNRQDYRVIEMNARLSRSSALASKATGYPLAFVATKLALGFSLSELKNSITKKTSAFFEPALDYLVVKIPRWDTHKLREADRKIGSEMKSVGEVMAIGRSFPEALQKAIRMLNGGAYDLQDPPWTFSDEEEEIHHATDRRIFALYRYFQKGGSVEKAHELSNIDPWFLHQIKATAGLEAKLSSQEMGPSLLLEMKRHGFSDRILGELTEQSTEELRQQRKAWKVEPVVKQIDTLAGEFDAETNYLYLTYWGMEHDLEPSGQSPVMVLGSGPYCIGSSVEFDWCAVNTARTLRQANETTVMINSNPETVSTDYDESDRLYFEELTLERVRDIADFEHCKGVLVSVGGQIANNLALPLHRRGYPILGTPADSIDRAENRQKFSSLLNDLNVDQPHWQEITTLNKAKQFAENVGYPVLVRPSYVLSGAAMNVVGNEKQLEKYLAEAATVSPDHPVVISDFIQNAKELEIDGVAKEGEVVVLAISEHVENAGVHSGDATIVLPPQRLYLETIRRCKKITRKIVRALEITGPFNIQFIAKDNALKVIECNLRASRSFPFVSKVTKHNFIEIATRSIMGLPCEGPYETLELDYVGVKTPQFSYNRLKGANPVAHVEMSSTGEVACLGEDLLEAFFLSWLATEQQIRGKRILVSVGGDQKSKLLPEIRSLDKQGWDLWCTEGTHEFLCRHGIASHFLYKASEGLEPNACSVITDQQVDLIINIPRHRMIGDRHTDGYTIRRLAIDHHIPLITDPHTAKLFLRCLTELDLDHLSTLSWREFVGTKKEGINWTSPYLAVPQSETSKADL